MNNSAAKKSKSVLGIISLIIAGLIGACFVIFGALALITQSIDILFVWVYPTLITAPIGIIIGLIAVFTKRAWLGLVLNILLLILNVGVIVSVMMYGMTHNFVWR
ncbi:MAG: hypothetical protein WA584_12335 [Pyrinomonadaceae bacterium]